MARDENGNWIPGTTVEDGDHFPELNYTYRTWSIEKMRAFVQRQFDDWSAFYANMNKKYDANFTEADALRHVNLPKPPNQMSDRELAEHCGIPIPSGAI